MNTKTLSPLKEAVHKISSALSSEVQPMIRLADISKWQAGPIIYADMFNPDLPGHLDGLIVKATEGVNIIDNMFTTHWQGAVSHAPVMVYHFFRSNLSGAQQADFLLQTIEPLRQVQGSTVVWLDIETPDNVSNSTRINRVKSFLATVEAEMPGRVGVYSSPYLWSSLMTINGMAPAWINLYWQWPAHWTSASSPSLPMGWTFDRVKVWQYGIWDNHSWVEAMPGIGPDVDANRGYFSSREALSDFVGINPAPPDPPLPGLCDCSDQLAALQAQLDDHEARIVALEGDGGVVEPPPVDSFVSYTVTDDKTLAKYIDGINQAGKPLIANNIYEDSSGARLRWNQGDGLQASPNAIQADGGSFWVKLKKGANGGLAVPESPDLFVDYGDLLRVS